MAHIAKGVMFKILARTMLALQAGWIARFFGEGGRFRQGQELYTANYTYILRDFSRM